MRRSVTTPAASFRYPPRARITRGTELERIAREGKRLRTRYIEVRIASPLVGSRLEGTGIRVGLIVARHGHTAVDRNQLKRRLRELARIHLLRIEHAVDLVLRTRTEAYQASFDVLRAEIEGIASHLEDVRTLAARTVTGPMIDTETITKT